MKTVTDHVKSKYSGAPSQTVGSNTGASLTVSRLFDLFFLKNCLTKCSLEIE